MKLEYILSFTKDGIPIHSSCYGSFCANLGYNKTLLSGFIAALTSMPSAVGHDDTVQNIEMGYTKLLFYHTNPSGHIVCIGIVKNLVDAETTDKLAKDLFKKIEKMLEVDFKDQTWIVNSDEIRNQMEEKVIHEIIEPTLKSFLDNDVCDHTNCPFEKISTHTHHLEDDEKYKNNIAEKIKWVYKTHKVAFSKKLLGPIIIPIFRFIDIRNYRKRERALKA